MAHTCQGQCILLQRLDAYWCMCLVRSFTDSWQLDVCSKDIIFTELLQVRTKVFSNWVLSTDWEVAGGRPLRSIQLDSRAAAGIQITTELLMMACVQTADSWHASLKCCFLCVLGVMLRPLSNFGSICNCSAASCDHFRLHIAVLFCYVQIVFMHGVFCSCKQKAQKPWAYSICCRGIHDQLFAFQILLCPCLGYASMICGGSLWFSSCHKATWSLGCTFCNCYCFVATHASAAYSFALLCSTV